MQPPSKAAKAPASSDLPATSVSKPESRKSRRKIHFDFKSPPPQNSLPIPKYNFDDCCVNKMAVLCKTPFDETRYSRSYALHLRNIQPCYEQKLRVLSWNLLMKGREKRLNPSHPAYNASELWCNRVKMIAAAIDLIKPAIIGCQELYENAQENYNQEEELYAYIGSSYEKYSIKSTDGEHNTIFLRRNTFKVIHATTYQCVDKAIGVVIVIFRDQKLVIINTHFSMDPNFRETQAHLVKTIVKDHLVDKELVIFLVDGNLFPNNPSNVSTKAGWDGPYIERIIKGDGLLEDAYDKSLFGHLGSLGTYTNDQYNVEPFKGKGTPGVRLDRIFVSRKIEVFCHAIDPFTSEGKPSSDHQAVIADLFISPLKTT